MTALSLFLHARWLRHHPAAASPRLPSAWPIVVVALVWWGASFCVGASKPANAAPVVPMTEAHWLGRPREDVVATLGKPLSALQRGDTEVLMYAKDVRVEIREDTVVAFRSGSGPAIVASDGTRYNATARGKVQRVASLPKPMTEEERADAQATASLPAAPPAPSAPPPTLPQSDATTQAEAAAQDAAADELADAEPAVPGFTDKDFENPYADAAKELSERGMLPGGPEDEETPPWMGWVEGGVSALLRFGFAVLMLKIAISWADLPCYLPDVLKVSALYVVVREGMHSLADFGGHWEWIQLFHIDDGVSFFALTYLLYRFKIALSGLTALKIAMATKGVTYFLMLIVGVAWSFMLG
jgi:hypothetical protein